MAPQGGSGAEGGSNGATSTQWLRWAAAAAVGGAGAYALYRWWHSGGKGEAADAPPPELICPITRELMTRPVFTSDGHTFERLAIIRWLQEHNTSPLTGEALPDRDIRPNRVLRTQIVEYRERAGLPPLPEWHPDPVETVQSIMGEEGSHGHHAHALGAHRHQHAHGHPHGHVGHPHGIHGGAHPPRPLDAFGVPPLGQDALHRLVVLALRETPFTAATAELSLGLPARAAVEDVDLVAQKVAEHPHVLRAVMHDFASCVELQRAASVEMYWRNDRGFVCPGNWAPEILAVRAGDVSAVERAVSAPGFSGAQPVAAAMLVEAVWCLQPARMVALLLSKGVPVDSIDSLGGTVLQGACARGDAAVVRALLDADAGVNLQTAVGGSTALHHAAAFGHADVVRLLLSRGANHLCSRVNGTTPLQLACQFGKHDAVVALLDGAPHEQVLHMADTEGVDALSAAARAGSEPIVRLLAERGAPLGTRAQDGALATHFAAWCGHMAVLQYLLDNHAESYPLEATNTHGDTVLQFAACHGDVTVLKELVRRGADINSQNREMFTPLHNATWRRHTQVAIELAAAGADVGIRTANRSTALHLAAWHGDVHVMNALLDAGAKPDARTRDGDTALHQAAFNGHTHLVIELLARHGKDKVNAAVGSGKEVFIDAQKCDGATALHLAAQSGHAGLVDVLLSKGCNPTVADRNGRAAQDAAQLAGRADIALKLRSAVAAAAAAQARGGGGGGADGGSSGEASGGSGDLERPE